MRCWGDNTTGQLGNDSTVGSFIPIDVPGLSSGVASVVAGDNQTCVLTAAGGVKCWGNNLNGQLGDGTNTQRTTPTDVVGLGSGVITIGAGDNHTCAGLANGTIQCWGWGTSGQLGHNAISSSNVPVTVQGLPAGTTAVEISAGYRHTCAVLSNGSARCWGRNTEGQLGTGTTTASRVAVTPVGLSSGVTAIVAGGAHTCAVQNGTVRCFGLNGAGQLGNGTTTTSTSPVTVSGITDATAVAAGGSHSCARSNTGGVRCWGLNQEGELGINDPTVNNVTTPRDVNGLTSGQAEITAGIQHTCSRTATTLRCWGVNTSGQLGNGTTTRSFTPLQVTGF